jgi:hypothetical protein
MPRHGFVPRVEGMESRALLSGLGAWRPSVAMLARNTRDGDGTAAILAALRGGPGAEFLAQARKHVRNVQSVLLGFATGARTKLEVPGFAAVKPGLLETYTGPRFDQFKPVAAGAVLLAGGKTLSLGAIVDGPIDYPLPVNYVWGLDLGRGSRNLWAEHPGVKADTLIRVSRSATGAVTLTLTDLVAGTTQELDPRLVKIAGPTVRVRLKLAQLPDAGAGVRAGTFSFWSESGPGGIETIGAILGDPSLRIGTPGRSPGRR